MLQFRVIVHSNCGARYEIMHDDEYESYSWGTKKGCGDIFCSSEIRGIIKIIEALEELPNNQTALNYIELIPFKE